MTEPTKSPVEGYLKIFAWIVLVLAAAWLVTTTHDFWMNVIWIALTLFFSMGIARLEP